MSESSQSLPKHSIFKQPGEREEKQDYTLQGSAEDGLDQCGENSTLGNTGEREVDK